MQDLETTLDEVRHIYAISHMVLHVNRSSGMADSNPLLMLTYPPEWVKQYRDRDYFSIDPVVRLGRRGFLPVEWPHQNGIQAEPMVSSRRRWLSVSAGKALPCRCGDLRGSDRCLP
ncbi:hypothetical protein GGI59_003137 [Rhizobium lentis]|uniref:Transcription factor LuxR-like autoinducer-binding domain-containing protein n=1 Tax=Rhizobium lentis TaxID=1138194 RepID=A0A7W8UNV7_9HYPH|nr:hypothetical protein [Rhizobium lentis]MBB5561461.1 hypothetical protein [Rhizobium lentis]MBB5568045.1 hypothetical protein [Rhizobium lentis]